jgi:hypothetical protein
MSSLTAALKLAAILHCDCTVTFAHNPLSTHNLACFDILACVIAGAGHCQGRGYCDAGVGRP